MTSQDILEELEDSRKYHPELDGVVESLYRGETLEVRNLRALEDEPMEYTWMADPEHRGVEYNGETFEVDAELYELKSLFRPTAERPERRYSREFDPSDFSREELEDMADGEFEDVDGVKSEQSIWSDMGRLSAPSLVTLPLLASPEPLLALTGGAGSFIEGYRQRRERTKRTTYKLEAGKELRRMEKMEKADFLASEYADAEVEVVRRDDTEEWKSSTKDLNWQEIRALSEDEVDGLEFRGRDVERGLTEALDVVEGSEEYVFDSVYAEPVSGSERYQIVVEASQVMGGELHELEEPLLKLRLEDLDELKEFSESGERVESKL